MTDYRLITSDGDLEKACELLSESSFIGVDTEFERQKTFYPITGLVQIGDEENFFLVDPLEISHWQPLKQLLADSSVTKIMHSCSEDLEVFRCNFDVIPVPIFDTQVAAACAGYDLQLGYQKLVAELLNEHVEKGETRSEWLRRPLSESQLSYAVEDIVYLPQLYQLLVSMLEEKDRLDLCLEDCKRLVDSAAVPPKVESWYRQVRNAWVLGHEQLLVLKALCAWREQEIRAQDIPRTFFIPDNVLWAIAKFLPNNPRELQQINGMEKRWLREYSGIILDMVFDTLDVASTTPVEPVRKPLGREAKPMFDELKKAIRRVAEQEQLDPSVVCRKKTVEKLADHILFHEGDYPEELTGWRQEVIAGRLEEIIRSYSGLAGDNNNGN